MSLTFGTSIIKHVRNHWRFCKVYSNVDSINFRNSFTIQIIKVLNLLLSTRYFIKALDGVSLSNVKQ